MMVLGVRLGDVADDLLHRARVRARGLHPVLRLADLGSRDHLERARHLALFCTLLIFVLISLPPAMVVLPLPGTGRLERSEEHTSELQSLMRISYAVFCLKKKKTN